MIYPEGMETNDEFHERIRHEQQFAARLRLATERLELAEPEPPPKRLSRREERAALRALLDLPPSERG